MGDYAHDNRMSEYSQQDNRESRYDTEYEGGYDSRRESYMDPSASLQPLNTNMAHSPRIEDDRKSNDSGSGSNSSGDRTKVGTPLDSQSGHKTRGYPGAHSSEGSVAGYGVALSDSSHDNHVPGYAGAGYADAPMYHPSSPSSAQSHGSPMGYSGNFRYRQGSYAGSGAESARASSIGTDHVANIPYNTSRVALNHEWRSSSDLDSIHVAPGKEMYGSPIDRPDAYDPRFGPGLVSEKDGSTYVPIPPSSPAMGQSTNEKGGVPGTAGPDGSRQPEPAIVLARANRLAWIDGLRGLASIVIFTHHFADLTFAGLHPEVLRWGTYQSFIR